MLGRTGQAKTSLHGSGCYSFAGFLDMTSLDIDPNKIASPTQSRQASRPTSHERVEHGGAGLRELLDQPFHMLQTPGTRMPGRPRARPRRRPAARGGADARLAARQTHRRCHRRLAGVLAWRVPRRGATPPGGRPTAWAPPVRYADRYHTADASPPGARPGRPARHAGPP